MKNKINKNFVINSKESIYKEAIEKAREHNKDAKLLIENKRHRAALCSSIEGLEELVKARLIKREDFLNLQDLVNHGKKATEIMRLSAECYDIPMLSEKDLSWAQETIPQMREDATYTKLIPSNDETEPDWKEKATRFYDFSSEILTKQEENPNIFESRYPQEKNTIHLPEGSAFVRGIRDSTSVVANFIKTIFKID